MSTATPNRKSDSLILAIVASAAMINALPANAQVRPAMVRSVDEPARVPYAYSQAPTCPFTNQCVVTFPVVPAGKRLRLTHFQVAMRGTTAAGFVLLRDSGNGFRIAMPIAPINGAYYGNIHSVNEAIDLIFEAGESPTLEMGVPFVGGSILVDSSNRFGVTGYLVDVAP
jgi:hypothetical protein